MNWTHTLALIPLHQFCLRVRLLTAYACTDPGPEIDTPPACADRLFDRLNGSPGLPGHSCNRFFIVWIIEFIAPGQSSKVPKPLLLIVIPLLNQTCYPFVNHRQSDCHAHWTASASHKLCHLVNPDRLQSPLLFFAYVLPDPQNQSKPHVLASNLIQTKIISAIHTAKIDDLWSNTALFSAFFCTFDSHGHDN